MTKGAGTKIGVIIASSTNDVGKTGMVHVKKRKKETRPPIYTIHQNKFKMDRDFNISHDTIKVLEENRQ